MTNEEAPGTPLSGIVLAGGGSRRLGQDKAGLRLWGAEGPTLLEAVVDHLHALCDEVLIVGGDTVPSARTKVRLVSDRYSGRGALVGIYSGLVEASFLHALVVACDMPFLNRSLLRYMADLPRDYDVLIPRLAAEGDAQRNQMLVEPLHAIYSRACQAPIRALLERGERQINRFFPQVQVRYLEPGVWSRFDPTGLSFRNINTPADLAAAREILRA